MDEYDVRAAKNDRLGRRFSREFFEADPDAVARALVGAELVVRGPKRTVSARIVETEAYGGSDDPASHAHRGPTPRCAVMFGPGGVLYVYRSYGIHWCLNVVTGPVGTASAVLVRAAQIIVPSGTDTRIEANGVQNVLRGPGNLTRGLGVTGDDDGIDSCTPRISRIVFREGRAPIEPADVAQSARIGISRGQDRLSRYYLEGHRAVSAPRGGRPAR